MANQEIKTRIWQDRTGLWRYTVHVRKQPSNSIRQYGEGFSDDLQECLEEALAETRTHAAGLKGYNDG